MADTDVHQTRPGRRLLDFDELEAWLKELPWWREWVQDIGGAVTPKDPMSAGGPAGGKPGSPTEREAFTLLRLRSKVDLLNTWVGYLEDDGNLTGPGGKAPKLPPELARLVHYRYMAKTAVMGLPVDACCQELKISRRTFHRLRQQALSLLVTAIYTSGIEMGRPYADCQDGMVPREARDGGFEAEIRRCDREARECERRASTCTGKGSKDLAEHWRSEARRWRDKGVALRRTQEEE